MIKRPRGWCGTGADPKNKKPTKFDKILVVQLDMIDLLEKQLKLQEQLLETLNRHHKDARKAWKL